MKLKIIGTSCTWFERLNTSYVIDKDIIFDVPGGNYKEIIKYTDISKLKSVIISHFHNDHFADFRVIATLTMRHYEKYGRTEKLRVYSPKGILEHLVSIAKLTYSGLDECNEESLTEHIDFITLEDVFEFEEGNYKIKAYKMEHGAPETYGFTFTDKEGKVVAFSADTKMCDNLHKLLENADHAFVEMSSTVSHRSHLSIAEFEELEKKYKNAKFYPVHTSDRCQQYAIDNGMNYVNDGDELLL